MNIYAYSGLNGSFKQEHFYLFNPVEVTFDNYRQNMAVVPLDNYRSAKMKIFSKLLAAEKTDFFMTSDFSSIYDTTAGLLIYRFHHILMILYFILDGKIGPSIII